MRAPTALRSTRLIALIAVVAVLGALPLNPARAATTANPMDGWKLKSLFAWASVNDVVYVPRTDRLLVAVGLNDPSVGNELVEVNPSTGRVGRHAYFGSQPQTVAVSQNGLFAYVGFGGTSAIAKVALATFTLAQAIKLPNHAEDGARFARDIAVAPGTDNVIVATLSTWAAYSPNEPEMWAFVNGIALPRKLDPGPEQVVARTATEFLGSDGYSIERVTLGADGLSVHGYFAPDGFGGFGKMAGRYFARRSGQLIDPDKGTVVRRYADSGYGVAPTLANDRIAFVDFGRTASMTVIKQYVLSTGALVGSRDFTPLEVDTPTDVVATSAGYAIVAASGLHLFGPGVVTDAPSNVPTPPKSFAQSWVQTSLNLQARDLVWDPIRRLLYASVGPDDLNYPNEIVAINPSTQRVVKHVPVGGEPAAMDMTDLGTALFVAQPGTHSVVKVDLLTFLPIQVVPLGLLDGYPLNAGDIDVMPGSTDTFAIAVDNNHDGFEDDYTYAGGAALFTLGIRAPSIGGDRNVTTVQFESPLALYGLGRGTLTQMRPALDGLETVDVTRGWQIGMRGTFVFAKNGLAWSDYGTAFEPSQPMVAKQVFWSGSFVLDERRNRMFQVAYPSMFEYEMSTGKRVATLNLNGTVDGAMALFGNGIAGIAGNTVTFFAPVTCLGREATLPRGSATGTSGDDVMIGTDGNDTINGGGGNDIICGLGGDDWVVGGDGQDFVDGGAGTDFVYGGAGADTLVGEDGDDRLNGGRGIDRCDGGSGQNLFADCEIST